MAPHTYISLFSGAGGLDLALRIAEPSARCACYCEREGPAAAILATRMAEGVLDAAPIWSDVKTFPSELYRGRVAGIVGGFPCTDLSVAGRQAGITGEHSGLWFEYARLIREIQPRWVFIENVPPVLHLGNGSAVLGELAACGFDAEWLSIRASDVGAPHKRERVFIYAWRQMGNPGLQHVNLQQREVRPEHQGAGDELADSSQLIGRRESIGLRRCAVSTSDGASCAAADVGDMADTQLRGLRERGEPSGRGGLADGSEEAVENAKHAERRANGSLRRITVDAGASSGDVANPGNGQIQEPRRGAEGRDGARPAGEVLGDTAISGLEIRRSERSDDREKRETSERARIPLFPPGPADADAWRRIIAERPDLAPAVESDVRGLDDGLADKLDLTETTRKGNL